MLSGNLKRYPSKATVNLVLHDHSRRDYSKLVVLTLALAILVGLFCKFAVLDRLSAAAVAQGEADAAAARAAQLQQANADYEAVAAAYAHYFSSDLESSAQTVDCLEVLTLLETKLMPKAGVASAAFDSGTLTLELNGIRLDAASRLIADLTLSPLVSSVEIYHAGAEDSADSTGSVTMNITLSSEGGDAS